MRVRRLLRLAFPPVSIALLVVACSSVPELRFVDEDAGSVSGGDAAPRPDGSTSSGGVDAASDQSAPSAYCADGKNPPPNGICCGKVACVGCVASDCSVCEGACNVATGACCKRGQSPIRCGAVELCK